MRESGGKESESERREGKREREREELKLDLSLAPREESSNLPTALVASEAPLQKFRV